MFGFSCLTSLGVFANERILFMRERANGYYSPYTYFTAKVRLSAASCLTAQVLFDTIPLRVVPPFILGAIIYKPVGLVPSVPQFWNLILVLVLFNLTASSAIFCLSIIVADGGVANLLGSLIMLYKCVRSSANMLTAAASCSRVYSSTAKKCPPASAGCR